MPLDWEKKGLSKDDEKLANLRSADDVILARKQSEMINTGECTQN